MKTAFPYRNLLELPTFEYGCLMELNIKKMTRQRQGTRMSNQYLTCHCWYDVEELTVPAVVISWHSTKFCVKDLKDKSITFCFLKLKAKKKAIFSKMIGGRLTFCGKFRSHFSKLMFTHQLLAEVVAMEWWKRKTRDYHQKLNVRVASRIAEQIRTNNLKKWGTFKVAYLNFHWFNDSLIWTGNSWIWTRTFEFQLVLLSFQLVLLNF